MKAQAIAQADYLDILFDNRNKAYGSYALRKQADRRMIQAFLFITGIILSFSIWTFIDARKGEPQMLPKITEHVLDLTHIETEKILPPKPVEPQTPPPAAKPTVKNTLYKIAPDEVVTTTPPPVDSFAGKETGPVSNAGTAGGTAVATTTKTGTGTGVLPEVPATPVIYAEVMPEFNGSIHSYLSKAIRYPQTAVQTGVQGRVLIHFVVNEDGQITNATVKRGIGAGCDEEALRVVKAMPAWKPGKQNGHPVKVYFTLPISFKLE